MKIKTPTLIVNKKIVLANIKRMIKKAEKNKVLLRPHFKTHQSAEVGNWFMGLGVKAIAVSSVRMAKCFEKAGWKDITIAFPINILELDEINDLTKRIKLGILVESIEVVKLLQKKLETNVAVWIKIDTGYNRTGIKWDKYDTIAKLAKEIKISDNQIFEGLLTHAGHSYKARSNSEILEIHKDTINKMLNLKTELEIQGIYDVKISVGDTPTASIADDFTGVDEIRPGNFVYYDLKQEQITSCSEKDIAIRLACPVVSKNKERLELVIDGGAIHLSKDFIVDEKGKKIFGYLSPGSVEEWGTRIENSYVSSISQEHGIIKVDKEYFNEINIGDVLLIIPVHACLTANIMKNFRLTTGEAFKALCT